MAKRKNNKKGFALMDYAIIGGVAVAAYFLFKQFKNMSSGGNSGTGNNTGGGNTGGGNTGGGTNTGTPPPQIPACAQNIIATGFPYSGFRPTAPEVYADIIFTPTQKSKILRVGSTGYEVMALQIWCNWNRTKSQLIAVDGVLGQGTAASFTSQAPTSWVSKFNSGTFTLNDLTSDGPLEGMKVLTQEKIFREGYIPSCPSLTNFYFGLLKYGGQYKGYLDASVVNEQTTGTGTPYQYQWSSGQTGG
jgi:hypothetical protein